MPDQTVHTQLTDIVGGYGAWPTSTAFLDFYVTYDKGGRLSQLNSKSISMLSQVGNHLVTTRQKT